ncbi:MAG: glycosyltransferase [Citrobacter freundii]|nr:MAG: glycosyltransferase [Citrobacter freundii]
MGKKILYISYDGMTDPLGQSQVLPYLVGLSKEGYEFTILSFEKKDRFERVRPVIDEIINAAGIKWEPMSFTTNPPVLSKFYDAVRMKRKAFALHRRNKYDMIHCRSYIAADLGLQLKRRTGVKFFFDMRGFWADEKKDAGTWDQRKWIFRRVYQYYKKKEKAFLREADYIISLTEAGKLEMSRWPGYEPSVPLTVIPCCSDMDHFSLVTVQEKQRGREILHLPAQSLVVSYLGSIGAWYMLDEMLLLFSFIKKKFTDAKFLFITHSPKDTIISKAAALGISGNDIVIVEASRKEVPLYCKASDINISFIKPVYSKISSSPTKLGEVLAMGLPVIVNSGVGDVEAIVKNSHSGFVLHHFNEAEYQAATDAIPQLLSTAPARIRENIADIYSLSHGIQLYSKAYKQVLGDQP